MAAFGTEPERSPAQRLDVIIRGGENVPVAEVEKLISNIPRRSTAPWSPCRTSDWASAAALSTSRGEHVAPRRVRPPGVAELTRFLEDQGMAKQASKTKN